MSGAKIVEGLKQAIAGDFVRCTVEGQTWVRLPDTTEAIVFWYKNYKGEEGYRRVMPISVRYGSSEWHRERQWLMLAQDTERNKQREFAMRDISGVVGAPILTLTPAQRTKR